MAARTLHNRGASWLAEGNRDKALADFVEAHRRFPNVALDSRRHPPQVAELFTRAFKVLQGKPMVRLTVTVTAPGSVRLDGLQPGQNDGKRTYDVPPGHYVLWMSDSSRTSLAHPIDVVGDTAVTLDFGFEGQFTWRSTVTARCAPNCEGTLRALRQKAGAERAVGVRENESGAAELLIVDASGTTQARQIERPAPPVVAAMVAPMPAETRGLSAWSFIPGGLAQWAQGRPAVATIFTAATAGAIAWHVIAVQSRHEGHADDSRTQQNLSAGVLIGVAVAGIVEAVVHDAGSRE